MGGDRLAGGLGDQLGAAAGDGVGVVEDLEGVRGQGRLGGRHEEPAGFSSWPPNSLRIADRTLFANSSSLREEKRS